jgi:DNA-binding winged helix-turn-helix (wHTH) protein
MPDPAARNSRFRFGLFELDGATGELRNDGKARPRLQGQPLEVLLQLLTRPGEVVTREELRTLLWPEGTFVDFDHGLNTAVNKLREALNDSAENPRFVQTIPRRGYRFIAPVEFVAEAALRTAEPPVTAVAPPAPQMPDAAAKPRHFALSSRHDLPDAPRGVVQILFSVIQIMYLCFYVASLARLREVQPLLSQSISHPTWLLSVLLVTALVGIPVRLYLLSASIFGYRGLPVKFLHLFPFVFLLDELWALAPFLLVEEIGIGLSLAATAALLYLPFSQRSLMLMGDAGSTHAGNL